MKRLFRLDVLLIIVVLLVDSLAAAVGPETGNFARLVDIGSGRKMYLKCRGTGSPTVLFDSSCDSVVLSRRWQRCCTIAPEDCFARTVAFTTKAAVLWSAATCRRVEKRGHVRALQSHT